MLDKVAINPPKSMLIIEKLSILVAMIEIVRLKRILHFVSCFYFIDRNRNIHSCWIKIKPFNEIVFNILF